MTKSLTYLAKCQKSRVPFTPVRYREERQLFGELIRQALQSGARMSAMATFEKIASEWAPLALGTNKINNKYLEHLLSYYKEWQKNRDRKQAINAAKCEIIFDALEYTPEGLSITNVMHPCPLRLPNGSNNLEDNTDVGGIDENRGSLATTNLGEPQVSQANPQAIVQQQLTTAQAFSNTDPILPPNAQTATRRHIFYAQQQPHAMLGPLSPQLVGPPIGLHHQRPLVVFAPQCQVPWTHPQHLVPNTFWYSHNHCVANNTPCTPSPSNQKKRKTHRTCQIPGCSNPNICPGSHRKHLCSYFKPS